MVVGVPCALAILCSCNLSLSGSFIPPTDLAISLTGIQTLMMLFMKSAEDWAVTAQIAATSAPFLVLPLFLFALAELVAKNCALNREKSISEEQKV